MPQFPILFSIDGSHRHEVIFITASVPLSSLNDQILTAYSESPNATEFMKKYKKAGGEKIGQLKVRWSTVGRDQKTWPSTTILTSENSEAVLRMVELSGIGKDTLEAGIEKVEEQ